MSERKEIERLSQVNHRLLLILGFGASLVLQMRHSIGNPDDPNILWFIQAIENTVYQGKELPPFPER